MKRQRNLIILITVLGCASMSFVDAVIQPGYFTKSLIKIFLFLLLPVVYSLFDKHCDLKALFRPSKKGLFLALLLGLSIYGVIVGSYFVFRNVFDFSALTSSLTASTGVNRDNFLLVAAYISFANSLLEEFFFRGFSFLALKRASNRTLAYVISATLFALYHVAMMIGWFGLPVLLLVLLGLFMGGVIFCYFNEKFDNIYLSWLVHMFSNFATNTVGFILFLD